MATYVPQSGTVDLAVERTTSLTDQRPLARLSFGVATLLLTEAEAQLLSENLSAVFRAPSRLERTGG